MNWQEYEELTRTIYETIGSGFGVKIVGHGHNCKIKGKSGVEHQIDVLTSHSDGFHTYKTAIECKYWEEHINKDIVMKIHEIITDCNLSKGIIVTKNGYTPDAVTYAEYVGVDIVILRKPIDEDWKGRIKDISIKIQINIPEITQVSFDVEAIENLTPLSGKVKTSSLFIKYADGTEESFEIYIKRTFHKDVKSEEDETIVYTFPAHTVLHSLDNNVSCHLKKVSIVGHLSVSTIIDEIKGENYIGYILKNVSDEKTLCITTNNLVLQR